VGTGYAISQGSLTASSNYNLTFVGANFAITAAQLTVTASSPIVTYGASIPTITPSYSGFVNGDRSAALTTAPACSTTYTTNSAVGTTPATSCASGAAANYSFKYAAGAVTINASRMKVTAANVTRAYGVANPSFSGSVTGAVNNNNFTESFSTTATTLSNVGSYAIVPAVSGGDLSNYAVSVLNGALSVTQAAPTTTLTAKAGAVSSSGESMTLTANVASTTRGTPTGTVVFYGGVAALCTATLDSTGVANCATTLAVGSTYSLTAVYNGDINFISSTSSATSITTGSLDFTLAAPSTTVQTLIPGRAVSYMFSITPDYGSYAGTVTFAASGLPAGATVTFSPSTIAPSGGAQTVTLTIQTAAATARNNEAGRKLAPLALALFLPLFGTKKMRRQGRRMSRWLCLLILAVGMAASAALSGCGGSYFSQAPKDYTLTVTATASSLQHSFNVTLNVQ
jgi:hypothetical protein